MVSAYQGLLGMIANKGYGVIMPGESTSMISEACDFSGSAYLTVYTNGAMNRVHEAHVRSVCETGAAMLLQLEHTPDGIKTHLLDIQTQTASSYQPAAEVVAKAVGMQLGILPATSAAPLARNQMQGTQAAITLTEKNGGRTPGQS